VSLYATGLVAVTNGLSFLGVQDASSHMAIAETPYYQNSSSLLVPAPLSSYNQLPSTAVYGNNIAVGSASAVFDPYSEAGTTTTVSYTLPSPLQANAKYLITVLNTPGIPQNVNATLSSTAAAGSNLAASTTYGYAITAVSAAGETLSSQPAIIVEGSSATEINLTWTAVPGATSYNIYKGTATSTGGQLATGITTNAYTDTGATATTSTSPPTTGVQGPGVYVTVNAQNLISMGLAENIPSVIASFTVPSGQAVSYVVEGFLLGAGSQLAVTLGDGDYGGSTFTVYTQVTLI